MHARTLSLLSLVLMACGGSVDPLGPSQGGDAGRDAMPTFDDGGPYKPPYDAGGPDSGPWSPICPTSLPAIGSACDQEHEGIQCEYGNAWWSVSCDPVVQCSDGQWATYQPSFDPCSPEPGPNPASCPASYADVAQGTSCSNDALSCVYAEGVCACEDPIGPVMLDDGGTEAYWGCLPEPGCPARRPRLGTACGDEGVSCTYSECDYGQYCQDGIWQGDEEACAGTASPGSTGSQP